MENANKGNRISSQSSLLRKNTIYHDSGVQRKVASGISISAGLFGFTLIISSRTHLHIWAQQNPQLLIDFPRRASELIPITNEAVEMLLQTRKIILTPSGELEVPPRSKILNREKYTDFEIEECLTKCAHIARWFEDAGKVENIYISLGVRP